jgi:hypothetical protein
MMPAIAVANFVSKNVEGICIKCPQIIVWHHENDAFTINDVRTTA